MALTYLLVTVMKTKWFCPYLARIRFHGTGLAWNFCLIYLGQGFHPWYLCTNKSYSISSLWTSGNLWSGYMNLCGIWCMYRNLCTPCHLASYSRRGGLRFSYNRACSNKGQACLGTAGKILKRWFVLHVRSISMSMQIRNYNGNQVESIFVCLHLIVHTIPLLLWHT